MISMKMFGLRRLCRHARNQAADGGARGIPGSPSSLEGGADSSQLHVIGAKSRVTKSTYDSRAGGCSAANPTAQPNVQQFGTGTSLLCDFPLSLVMQSGFPNASRVDVAAIADDAKTLTNMLTMKVQATGATSHFDDRSVRCDKSGNFLSCRVITAAFGCG